MDLWMQCDEKKRMDISLIRNISPSFESIDHLVERSKKTRKCLNDEQVLFLSSDLKF
jgi:hypothetical protein